MNSSVPPELPQELLDAAGKRLGASPAQLRQALEGGGADRLIEQLSAPQKQQVQKLLGDRAALERFLSTPQAKLLLKKLLRGQNQ